MFSCKNRNVHLFICFLGSPIEIFVNITRLGVLIVIVVIIGHFHLSDHSVFPNNLLSFLYLLLFLFQFENPVEEQLYLHESKI